MYVRALGCSIVETGTRFLVRLCTREEHLLHAAENNNNYTGAGSGRERSRVKEKPEERKEDGWMD